MAKTTRVSAPSKSPRQPGKAAASISQQLGLPLSTWISTARLAESADRRSGPRAFVVAIEANNPKKAQTQLKVQLANVQKWQIEKFLSSELETAFFQGALGPVMVLKIKKAGRGAGSSGDSALNKSGYARSRDLAASVCAALLPLQAEKWILDLGSLSEDEKRGFFVGLEMATYSYPERRKPSGPAARTRPQLFLEGESSDQIRKESSDLSLAVNIARHLVNLPAGDLNPRTYAELVVDLFQKSPSVEVEVWEAPRLRTEQMNLLLAVGAAAAESPRLVHLRYRPKNPRALKPIAIVGKGITFDSGGLDIKPSSGMRLMKKDMGGSAACVGLAKWAELSRLEVPLDIYLSLAENAISGPALRPGDVIRSRQGLAIEIHNTDAEGRLVLADALDLAVKPISGETPRAVIDIATLTGAIKVGLGGEIAGLFANDDDLAEQLLDAGASRGDLAWRMPLYAPYKSMLRSTFADYANASDGFAGAITAALFLELFVGKIPWAHLDIYAWRDGAGGAYSEAGGSGQSVQMLAEFFKRAAVVSA